jgi:hypothetical protein
MSVIPTTQEVDVGKLWFWGQSRQKQWDTIFINKPGVVTYFRIPSYVGSIGRKNMVRTNPR